MPIISVPAVAAKLLCISLNELGIFSKITIHLGPQSPAVLPPLELKQQQF